MKCPRTGDSTGGCERVGMGVDEVHKQDKNGKGCAKKNLSYLDPEKIVANDMKNRSSVKNPEWLIVSLEYYESL